MNHSRHLKYLTVQFTTLTTRVGGSESLLASITSYCSFVGIIETHDITIEYPQQSEGESNEDSTPVSAAAVAAQQAAAVAVAQQAAAAHAAAAAVSAAVAGANAAATPDKNLVPVSQASQPKRLHVSNIPFRFRDPDLRNMFGVRTALLIIIYKHIFLFNKSTA